MSGWLGPYEIREQLGMGGMGAVYRARHGELGVERAVKVMHRSDARRLARFEREVEALARVRHPNVVTIHDSGVASGQPFFVMDLLEGEPLDVLLARERRAWAEGVRLAVGVARGVGALHAAGVIHRDLKPQNVVLAGEGRPVVIDLGLALAPERDERLTKTGGLVGTFTYMAPEQFTGGEVTPATDVYALGLLVFHLATGTPAVEERSTAHETAAWIVSGRIPAPSERDPDLPESLDRLVARATARDPAARYADGDALADALEALLADPGPSARRQRRRRRALGAAGLGLLLALVGWGVSQGSAARAPSPDPSVPTATPGPARASAAPDRLAEGEAALLRARRARPERRAEALRAWLERYPRHPQRAVAERLRRARALAAPRLSLELRGFVHAATWVGPERFATIGGRWLSLHDARSGEVLQARKIPWAVTALTATAQQIAVGGKGGEVAWIDVGAEGLAFAVQRRPLGTGVRVLRFDPQGRRLAVGEEDAEVLLLPLPALQTEQRFGGHRSVMQSLAFSAEGRTLFTGCGISATNAFKTTAIVDCSVRRWRAEGAKRPEWRHPLTGKPNGLALSPDGTWVAIGSSTGQLLLVDAQTGKLVRTFEAPTSKAQLGAKMAHGGGIRSVAFSANGRRLHSAAEHGPYEEAGGLRTWDVETGELVRSQGEDQNYYGLELNPRGQEALAWSRERVHVWRVR